MEPAQREVARVLDTISMSDPRIPVAANVTGAIVSTAGEAKDALIRQVTGAVRWVDCVQALAGGGAEVFVEVGPGKVLSGLMKQIDATKKALNVEDGASLEKALGELSHLAG
jgi:[acyl-carrier-protein] S-malonyltransferase